MKIKDYLQKISEENKDNLLPVHSQYWDFEGEEERKSKVGVSFYNSDAYWTFRFYKPISKIINLNDK